MTLRRRNRRTTKGPEALRQDLVLDWLTASHILAFRINTGAVVIPAEGGHKRRSVKYGVPGMADILCFPRLCPRCRLRGVVEGCPVCARRPWVLWIEMKSDTGKQTPEQKSFEAQVSVDHGQMYIVARSLEDVQRALGEVA